MSVLSNVELVYPTISLWSGKASLKSEEVIVSLPDIVSLGCKQIFDNDKLKPMQKYKKQVERLGLRFGIRFEGGYMIPLKLTAQFLEEFNKIKAKFDEEKKTFLADYDQNCQTFIDAHAAHEAMIRSSLPNLQYLERRIGCSVRTYRAEQSAGEQVSNKEVKQTVFDEVAVTCNDILKGCFIDKTLELKGSSVNRRMKPVVAKLTSFSFVDSRVNKVISSINSYLSSITLDKLNKDELDTGMTLFSLLANSATLESIIDNDWTPVVNQKSFENTVISTLSVADDAYF